MKPNFRFENENQWSRKSKVYKAKTFSALKELYGSAQNDKESQSIEPANRKARTDSVCSVVEKTGV